MQKWLSVFVLMLSALPACSRLDIAAQWADTFVASKVDDYFDMSSEQSRALKQSFNQDLEKIKHDVLPLWIEEAQKLEKEVAAHSLNEKKIAALVGGLMMDVETIPSYFSETAGKFIASTEDRQWVYFAKAFQKKNEEEKRKFENKETFQRDYRRKYVKYFEMFLGKLTAEQYLALDQHIARSPYPTELKFKNKEWVVEQFMTHKGDPTEAKRFVQEFVKNPPKFHLPEYRKQVLAYQRDLERLIVDIGTHLTSKQRKELLQNLKEKVVQLQRIQQRT